MANKRLNASITIGGGVGRSLTKGLTSTSARLGEVGNSIRTVEKRQKTLGKSINTFGRMGRSVDGLRDEYGDLTHQLESLRKKQQQLLRVEKARQRVSGAYSNFTGQVGKSIGTLRTASFAAIGVGTAMVGLTSKVASTGDAVAKTARSIGFNAQAFQEYQFAADRVGVSQETFNQSLGAFGKRLGELKTRGSGALATQLKKMNPALYDTLKATESTQEAFEIYTQAMRESTDASERNAMASAAFSRAGLKMGLIAQSSSEEIQRLRKRAEELGYVLGDDDLAAAEKFTDEMTNMQATLGGVGKLVGAELMPVLSKFFKRFTGFVIENRDKISGWAQTIAEKTEGALPSIIKAAKGIGQTLMAVGRLTGKLAGLVGGFDNLALVMVGLKFAPLVGSAIKLVGALGSMATALPMVATGVKAIGLALTANPIGLIVAAIAGAAYLIYKNWEPIKAFFVDLWEGVKSAFSWGVDFIKSSLGWTPLGLILNNWSAVTGFFGALWDGVKTAFSAGWGFIKDIFSWSPLGLIINNWSSLTDFFTNLWGNITNIAAAAFDWISDKLDWVGKAADRVASFFGFGDDKKKNTDKSQQTADGSQSVGQVVKDKPAPKLVTRPMSVDEIPNRQRSTTNSQTKNVRGGDTFQVTIHQKPGEDAEQLAQRVARIMQAQRRENDASALYDNAAGA